ncbi:MAG: glutamine cyclotransferase [Deltaproteobacteria bacterium]
MDGVEHVGGVDFDGERIWCATGKALCAIDPESGAVTQRLDILADAGTAFDGTHLYQLVDSSIQKILPSSGEVIATLPSPCQDRASGMAWAEGCLWVGEYAAKKIHRVDAATGEHLGTLESNRYVTGVTWADGHLWHGATDGSKSALRRVAAETGEVEEQLEVPGFVSGLAAAPDGFFCGAGRQGAVRFVRKKP